LHDLSCLWVVPESGLHLNDGCRGGASQGNLPLAEKIAQGGNGGAEMERMIAE
jgi:hypothetical protein